MTETQKELVITVLEAALDDLERSLRQNMVNDWMDDAKDDLTYINAVNAHLEELRA